MQIGAPMLILGHYLAGLGALGLLWFLWSSRDSPGARMWFGVLLVIALWAMLYGTALLVFDPAIRMAFELAVWFCIAWAGVLFLSFALSYTGRAHVFWSFPMRALIAVQGLAAALVLSNPLHHLLFSDFRIVPTAGAATVMYTNGPLVYAIAIETYLTVGLGVFLLAETVARYGREYRWRMIAIASTPLLPGITTLLWLFKLGPTPQLQPTVLSFIPHLALDAYALFGRDMFELPPAIRRAGERAAIDDLGSAVVIVTDDGRVIDLNSEAERLFGVVTDAVLAVDLSAVLATDVDLDEPEQTITLRVGGERRTFKVVASPFETKSGRHSGYTVVLQEVTAEIQRKQRLEVLNRILRHNLRNDLNVVQLQAQELQSNGTAADPAENAATIEAVSDDLIDMGEKVRTATRALENVSYSSVTVRPLLEDIVAGATREHPSVTVDLEVPRGLAIDSDRDVLSLVFSSVVENAIEHTESEPTVSITASESADGESLRVRVTDDGPGIPEHERVVIEEGAETALEHGSGVGLWLIHWGVTILGGDVTFEVTDDGTTVAIRLPTSVEAGRVDDESKPSEAADD